MTVTTVSSGKSVSGTTVSAGDTLDVLAGGLTTSTTVLGTEEVFGAAVSTTVSSGGLQVISGGGIAMSRRGTPSHIELMQ